MYVVRSKKTGKVVSKPLDNIRLAEELATTLGGSVEWYAQEIVVSLDSPGNEKLWRVTVKAALPGVPVVYATALFESGQDALLFARARQKLYPAGTSLQVVDPPDDYR